jgi:hypothetical protein
VNDTEFRIQAGSPGKDVFVVLEENLQNLVKRAYGIHLLERVPQDIRNTIQRRIETRKLDQERAYRELTLGQYTQIFRTDRKVFCRYFVAEDKTSFYSEDLFDVAITHITRMRNIEHHSSGYQRQLGDEDLLRTYLEKINGCLARILQDDYVGSDQDITGEDDDHGAVDQDEEEPDDDKT